MQNELNEEKYKIYDRTFSAKFANKKGLVWGGTLFVVILIAFRIVWGGRDGEMMELLWMALTVIVFFFLHELLHALGYIVAGKVKPGDVKLGVMWKSVTPYAHCRVPIRAGAYRFAVMLPVVLGVGPLAYAFLTGSHFWMMVGTILLVGSIGDWLIIRSIEEFERDALVEDHPSEIGCRVYVKRA
ncbi:DUF3267 domain-containing protein [Alteribacter natronophilus]|uniref:DUF3267 domain-containing protein n=1 Tax=Alteribacter natronophilus TaxID=2583810 RepID=UPI00110E5328|nr:DUF3267 domain-containing protein [Alteribacter natronophilus]TMW71392.1 DUF3267 domain-containing protein [Alteribacter natronophilus]